MLRLLAQRFGARFAPDAGWESLRQWNDTGV